MYDTQVSFRFFFSKTDFHRAFKRIGKRVFSLYLSFRIARNRMTTGGKTNVSYFSTQPLPDPRIVMAIKDSGNAFERIRRRFTIDFPAFFFLNTERVRRIYGFTAMWVFFHENSTPKGVSLRVRRFPQQIISSSRSTSDRSFFIFYSIRSIHFSSLRGGKKKITLKTGLLGNRFIIVISS